MIKEFFKPTISKIAVVSVILIISVFVGFSQVAPKCKMPGCYSSIHPNKIIFPVSENMTPLLHMADQNYSLKYYAEAYLFGIIYWYLGICLIIFIGKKIFSR